MYDDADVYTIVTKYGYQTNIVFDTREEIETISVGDRSMWQIIPAGHRLFIRPMSDGVTTNMTVLTNRHSYQFDLKSVAADDKDDNIYVARFIYPRQEAVAPAAAPVLAAPPTAMTPAPAPATTYSPPVTASSGPGVTRPVHPNYNYTYAGPDELAPLQVYDDGRTTFIRYRSLQQPLPGIYIADASGNEHMVPYAIKDDLVVVDMVADEFSLKANTGTVTVYNELLNPR